MLTSQAPSTELLLLKLKLLVLLGECGAVVMPRGYKHKGKGSVEDGEECNSLELAWKLSTDALPSPNFTQTLGNSRILRGLSMMVHYLQCIRNLEPDQNSLQ